MQNQITQAVKKLISILLLISFFVFMDFALGSVKVSPNFSEDKTHKFKQSGLTVSLSVPVIDTATGLVDTVKTVGKSKNSRVNAMAAVNTALQSYDASKTLQNVADKGLAGGASLSISLGSQKSKSESHIRGGEVQASQIQAGGKANLIATGAKQSNINIIGSDVAGAKGTNLIADNDVNLLASTGKNSERSKNKSSGGSIGLKISSTGEFGVSLAANKGKGYGNGDSVTHRNTHVGSASGKTNIQAGNKLTLKGAQAIGKGVKVTAKDLDIESLQDSATYKGKQKNIGGSITVGPAGVSGSANLSKSKANADHLAVSEQSGIFAGDDGFDVEITNHTRLKGGLITSTGKAEAAGNNRFVTGTISTEDIQNHSNYDAKGFGIGLSASTDGGLGKPSFGNGKDSDSQSSTTVAGVGTENIIIEDKNNVLKADDVKTTATTEQVLADSDLQNRFDKDEVIKEINLQVKVTKDFRKNAAKLINSYTLPKQADLRKKIEAAKTEEEKTQYYNDIYKLQYQKRFLQTLVGIVAGTPDAAITQGTLQLAATKMREESLANSRKSPGVVIINKDGEKEVINNVHYDSGYFDGVKLGGIRLDLDTICGKDNSRCEIDQSGNLIKDVNNNYKLKKGDKYPTYEEIISNPEYMPKIYGETGGFQPEKGGWYFRGKPLKTYEKGSFSDLLIESFAGSHDFLGGQIWGWYGTDGNTSRGRSKFENMASGTTAAIAVPVAAPFALSDLLSPEAVQVILKLGGN